MLPRLVTLLLLICTSLANANSLTEITSLGTASQTHSHSSGLYPPENAIDGDLTTFNHTSSGLPGAAWELHFPGEQPVIQIDITTRDCCGGRLNGATLRLFDAEAEMIFEIPIADSGPLTTFTATLPVGTLARDIRIGFEPDQTGIVHLAEVNVYSKPNRSWMSKCNKSSASTTPRSSAGIDPLLIPFSNAGRETDQIAAFSPGTTLDV
jgi:hypothetical protein